MSEEKILIIDDDTVTTAVLEEYLSNFGYNVFNAKDGNEGLHKVNSIGPDLILLDIMMPGKDGIQILKEIKLTPGFTSIPILLLSAVNRPNIKVKGLELGADDYITKPVDKTELLARIKVSLKRSGKNKKNGHLLDGNLSEFTLSDLLQSIEMGKKTALISLPDIDGRISIKDGIITRSEQGNFSGIMAIRRLFFLEKGRFTVDFNKVDESSTDPPLKLISILLDSISYVDEIKNMARSLPGKEKKINISKELIELTGIKNFKDLASTTTEELIALMKGKLKENVESLIQIKHDFPHLLNG
ncbi:MAG: response regulator [Acidobacteriota bacterium]